MDSVLCLESEIRKAQANKEMVVSVFFNEEKSSATLWREGLLSKLEKIGIGGKMFHWVLGFMLKRQIQVRVEP